MHGETVKLMVDVHYIFISFMVCEIIKQRSELSELLL